MNYQETIQYLFNALPMYQQVGKMAYKANLDNAHKLDTYFNHPHRKFMAIHVGGTNGKGSTSHMLATVLQKAGYKVGLYTSPHLLDFRERIKVNGKPVPENYVVQFTAQHKKAFEQIEPSFFEMTVFMAFHYFANEAVDYAIIEVGLGGRLDATNIITPILSVITNIGMDHMQFLGNTLESIAYEKAGIIKPGVPVVIGESHNQTNPVFDKTALRNKSPLLYADNTYQIDYPTYDTHFNPIWHLSKCPLWEFSQISLDLKGVYQKENLATTLMSLNILHDLNVNISKRHIQEGLSNVIKSTGILGRWQVCNNNPLVICDIAHNLEGIQRVVDQLNNTAYNTLRMVLGFVNDKNIREITNVLPRNAEYYLCEPNIPRALKLPNLEVYFKNANLPHRSFKTVNEAAEQALTDSDPNDLNYVGGSTFVVADYLSAKKNNNSF